MSGPRTRADGAQQVPAAPIEQQRPAAHGAHVFENAPVSLWHEDFSGVKQRIDSLSQEGIEDFRKYFENHADVVAECARLVTILDVNLAAVKLHHAGNKKELTDSLTSRFSEESYKVFREGLIALANGEMSFESDAVCLTLDGERIDVMLRMFVDPTFPNWSSIYVALTDITERKQAEEELRLSAEIAENMAEGINLIRIDDGIIVYTNDRFDEIFGYGQGELIGQHVTVLNAAGENNPEETASEIINCVKKNGSWHGEILNVKKDRTEFWSHVNVSTFEHSKHGPVFLTVQEDITERKRAEEAPRENEQRYRHLFEHAPLSIWEEDFSATGQWLDGLRSAGVRDLRVYFREHPQAIQHAAGLIRIVNVNEGTLRMFEAESREALLTTPPDDASDATGQSYTNSAFVDQLVAIWNGKSRFEVEFSATTLKGNKRECLLQWTAPRGRRGLDLSRVIVAISDITERKRAERAVRVSEARLNAFIESAPVGMVLFDDQLRYLKINESLAEINGLPVKDHLGKTMLEVVPHIAPKFEAMYRRILTTGEPVLNSEVSGEVLSQPGVVRHWLCSQFRIPGDELETSTLGVIVVEITASKRAEEAVRESEERFRSVFEQAGVAVGVVESRTGRHVQINRKFEDLIGYSNEEMTKKTWMEISHADDIQENLDKKHDLAKGTISEFSYEKRLIHKDGSVIWINLTVAPIWDSGGKSKQNIAIVEDITERKRAEDGRREVARWMEATFAALEEAVFVLTADRVLVSVNEAAIRMFGYSNNELAEHSAEILHVDRKHYVDFGNRIQEAFDRDESAHFEFKAKRKNGQVFPSEHTLSLLKEDTGEIIGILSVVRDLTERKRAEEEKRKLQDHLRHAQKMDAVGQLAAGVAHEFNNILVGILGNAELLLAASGNDLPERFKPPLEDIERAGMRAADLTKQLLSFARKKNPKVSLLDVHQVITENKNMLQRIVGENIALKTLLTSVPALVRADEAEIEQAILNLVMNARDAMPNGGTITIQTDSTRLKANEVAPGCKPGRYVRLSVVDDGCGMPPEIVERIFEPFFTTKSVGKGTGLGLSTVFADVSNSGGFVTVESRVGEGTVIRVHLPEADGAIETTDAGAEHVSRPVGGNETILLCDDEEIVLASVSKLLQALGYPVLSANSPQEAIEVAAAYDGPISLLLTDVTMPDMDGIELSKEIRRFYPDIRVVLTSGYAEDVLRGSASEDEHFKFLQKPVPYDVLARTIREGLD